MSDCVECGQEMDTIDAQHFLTCRKCYRALEYPQWAAVNRHGYDFSHPHKQKMPEATRIFRELSEAYDPPHKRGVLVPDEECYYDESEID